MTIITVIGLVMSPICWAEHIAGIFCVSIPLLICAVILPGSFGGGDVKLMAVSGLFLGWKSTLLAFVTAVFLAGTYLYFEILRKRIDLKSEFAFGPALCAGVAITMVWGKEVLQYI